MPVPKDPNEQKVIDDIRRYGLHVIGVAEDEGGPGFAYSIGLFETYAHPEIILVGLSQELSNILINNMAHDINGGKTFVSGEFHEDVLDDFLCYFGKVPTSLYKEYVGWNLWYYEGDQFPLVQCIYPSVEGIFPWQKSFPDEARWNCPMLANPPSEH